MPTPTGTSSTPWTPTGLKGDDLEPAGKFGKAVDVTFLAAPDGAQKWSSIVENLTMAMRFDVEEMTAAFGDANDFDSVTRNMGYVGLDPWYTCLLYTSRAHET